MALRLAQVVGKEMWESGFQVGVVVGSSAPLHTAAVAPWIARCVSTGPYAYYPRGAPQPESDARP